MNLYENRDSQNSKQKINKDGHQKSEKKLLKEEQGSKTGNMSSGLFSRQSKSKAQSKNNKKGTLGPKQ
jgi:hypothetical protein